MKFFFLLSKKCLSAFRNMERRLETQEIPVLSIDWLLEIIAVDFPTLFHIKKHLNSKSSQNRSLSQNFYRKIPTLNPSKISQKVSMKLSVKWNLSNYSSNKSTRGKKQQQKNLSWLNIKVSSEAQKTT